MPNVPEYKQLGVTRHEWTVGSEDEPTAAKDFRYGLHVAYEGMKELGVDLEYDDAFFVRGAVTIYVEKTELEPGEEISLERRVRKLLVDAQKTQEIVGGDQEYVALGEFLDNLEKVLDA